MTKEFVWAIDEDGKPCKCFAKPENRGKGKCPHKFHQVKGETTQQLLSRSKRKVAYQGVSGTVKWSVDDDGLLLFEPVNGDEGTFEDTGEKKFIFSHEEIADFPPIEKIEAIGKIYFPEDSSYAFYNLTKLTTIDFSHFDTSKVKDMNHMFSNCRALTNLDLSNFDTSNVTDMTGMFYNCWKLTSPDLSSFDTHKVKSMNEMFDSCWKLADLDLSNFDTSKVKDMNGMFCDCLKLTDLDLSNFDTSNVTDMGYVFAGCHSLVDPDLCNFDTSNVTDMSCMFNSCKSLTSLDVSNFDTSNVTNMDSMFRGCKGLTSLDLSNFDMNKLENMEQTFCECTHLRKLDLSSLTNPKNIYLKEVFDKCKSLSNLILPDDVEKRSNDLLVLSTLFDYTDEINFSPKAKKEIKVLLNLIEKSTGADLSKEKQKLENIPDHSIDYIALSKSRIHPVKETLGVLKILKALKVTKKDLQTGDFKTLKEKGVLSDINAFAQGVPLEDILA